MKKKKNNILIILNIAFLILFEFIFSNLYSINFKNSFFNIYNFRIE
jgi:hypothetical protein